MKTQHTRDHMQDSWDNEPDEAKMKTAHTPTPWSNTPMQPTIWANDGDLKVATIADLPWVDNPVTGKRESQWQVENANAAFIVKACNCHEELLEACKAALQCQLSPHFEHALVSATQVVPLPVCLRFRHALV